MRLYGDAIERSPEIERWLPGMSPGDSRFAVESVSNCWRVRGYGAYKGIVWADSLRDIQQVAHETLREFAPCTLAVPGDPPRFWRLDAADGVWKEQPDDGNQPSAHPPVECGEYVTVEGTRHRPPGNGAT
jgi:hypothetical protein